MFNNKQVKNHVTNPLKLSPIAFDIVHSFCENWIGKKISVKLKNRWKHNCTVTGFANGKHSISVDGHSAPLLVVLSRLVGTGHIKSETMTHVIAHLRVYLQSRPDGREVDAHPG